MWDASSLPQQNNTARDLQVKILLVMTCVDEMSDYYVTTMLTTTLYNVIDILCSRGAAQMLQHGSRNASCRAWQASLADEIW